MTERPQTIMEAIVARFQESFADEFQTNQPLGSYTTSGIGGNADLFVTVRTTQALIEAVTLARRQQIRYWVLGAASNVLVADLGIRGLVIRNRTCSINFRHNGVGVVLHAESGANLSALARQCARRGLAGLEWAAGIPGTIGGAVVGNAGAHGGDMAGSLRLATLLDADLQVRDYRPDQLGFGYRTSALKVAHTGQGDTSRVVLAAEFHLQPSPVEELEARVTEIIEHRKSTQPPGATMGCMFKNPVGDHAGRLIEEAGLKGERVGGVEISNRHANFFVSDEDATAEDVRKMMARVWHRVKDRHDVELYPEVELIGDWS